jgi:hypothetical protein
MVLFSTKKEHPQKRFSLSHSQCLNKRTNCIHKTT